MKLHVRVEFATIRALQGLTMTHGWIYTVSQICSDKPLSCKAKSGAGL